MNQLSEDKIKKAKAFMEFHYPEIKDLCKHFLTVISGILAFSVVFSGQIIDFEQAPIVARTSLIFTWLLFIIAFVGCGIGLYTIFLAAEQATVSLVYDQKQDFKKLMRQSYLLLDLAGISFGLGLILLAVTAALKFFF